MTTAQKTGAAWTGSARTGNTFYCTTPIYYVTAKPHLGSLYSTVLADIFTRWHRLLGRETFLLTGTDEHGQKVSHAAQVAGKEPQAFVDSFIDAFKETWAAYHIEYGKFIRTTDQEHVDAVRLWIRQLCERGDIYKSVYEGYYCTPCETFVPLLKAGEAPSCSSCGRATVWITEPAYFFRLSAYQEKLMDFYQAHTDFIVPAERAQEVISFVKGGLKDLAISRSKTTVSWGIPFPDDDTQIVYVWADALNNYISAVGYGNPARAATFAHWWPAQLQVLGKDIVRFHAVFWPAFLMAAQLPLPERLLVHGWIKIGDSKMSKSLGNVVDPLVLRDRFGADAVRYYLARYIAVTHDAPFSVDEMALRINADLANDLGNLLQRLTTLAQARGATSVTVPACSERELPVLNSLAMIIRRMDEAMEACMVHRAYAHLWEGIALINAYVHGAEPWKMAPEHKDMFERILAYAGYWLAVVAVLTEPVMPVKMGEVLQALGFSGGQLQLLREQIVKDRSIGMSTGSGTVLRFTKGVALFPRIELEKAGENAVQAAPQAQDAQEQETHITIDDFARVALIVGTITDVALVPKSDKLYRLTVDLGARGTRTVCSGVRKHFTPEALLNKQGIFVANLAPRSMMGIPSQGMMLFAEDSTGALQLVAPVVSVPAGTRLR